MLLGLFANACGGAASVRPPPPLPEPPLPEPPPPEPPPPPRREEPPPMDGPWSDHQLVVPVPRQARSCRGEVDNVLSQFAKDRGLRVRSASSPPETIDVDLVPRQTDAAVWLSACVWDHWDHRSLGGHSHGEQFPCPALRPFWPFPYSLQEHFGPPPCAPNSGGPTEFAERIETMVADHSQGPDFAPAQLNLGHEEEHLVLQCLDEQRRAEASTQLRAYSGGEIQAPNYLHPGVREFRVTYSFTPGSYYSISVLPPDVYSERVDDTVEALREVLNVAATCAPSPPKSPAGSGAASRPPRIAHSKSPVRDHERGARPVPVASVSPLAKYEAIAHQSS